MYDLEHPAVTNARKWGYPERPCGEPEYTPDDVIDYAESYAVKEFFSELRICPDRAVQEFLMSFAKEHEEVLLAWLS